MSQQPHGRRRVLPWGLGGALFGAALLVLGIVVLLCSITPFDLNPRERYKKDRARVNILHIVNSVHAYHLHYDHYPQSLEEARKYTGSQLREEDLIDPWRNDFQCSLGSNHGGADAFEVWTVAPDGEIIGNWPQPK